jgi:flagellar hook assembly protein FlgD/outer membrane protein OmpA-like peptidoglycan-associated protein
MKSRVRLFIAVAGILLCSIFPVFPQNGILDLYFPSIMGSGAGVASVASPDADVLNPAASGGTQRVTADLGYIGLAGLGAVAGWASVIDGAVTVPTRIGVFSGSARFMNPVYPSLNVGNFGALNFSFAKDIFPDLYLGAGTGFQIGADWGLGLDLGILHAPGDLGFLKDFRWGIAVRGIGKGYVPLTPVGAGTIPPAFTPDIGASFALLKTDLITLSFAPDLSFPSFQDLRFVIGGSLSIADFFFLDASYVLDLKDTLAGTARQIPFSAGLSFKLKTGENGLLNGGDVTISSAATPLSDGVVGFGMGAKLAFGRVDRTPPVVTLGSSETAYISPGTASDQFELSVPLTITDDRYIKGYRMIIRDSQGKVVRTIEVSDTGPASEGIANFFDRIGAVKKSIDVPPTIVWDGKDDSGNRVPDGTYSYEVEAWDDNNNLSLVDPIVIVDTTPPTVSASAPYLEFSPSGEGTKGTLPIEQSGSAEDLWIGTILDSTGKEVRQFRWTNDSPKSFTWNGRDSTGILVPDGTYGYRITSTDRAGNTGGAAIPNIVVNTQATPIGLSTNIPAFSPNGDGINDGIRLLSDLKVTAGIESWTLVVKDQGGAVKRTFSGGAAVPASVDFDGKDDRATRLPEGTYRASLNVVYGNGHTPTADCPPFILDVTPPSVTASAANLEFSPDGVGTRTALGVKQSGSTEILWSAAFKNSAGQAVRNLNWDQGAPKDFTWDGRDDNGTLVPDGTYAYRITSTDPAGNTGSAGLSGIVVNTVATPASLSVDLSAFSPNGDGVKDTMHFAPVVPVADGIEKWSLVVKDASGKARRSFTGQTKIPASVEFDGKDEIGTRLPEGNYSATLAVLYANGHDPDADSPPFLIDVTPPTATVTSDYAVFSPVGEGSRNLLTFTQGASKDAQWTGVVKDGAGAVSRFLTWSPRPDAKFVFDGHADDGSLMSDGSYTYTLSGVDRAGNAGQSPPLSFRIDTRDTPVIVTTDFSHFSPNGDGVKDSIKIIPTLKVATDVDTYEIRVKNAQGSAIRRFNGTNSAPPETAWNGRDDSGAKAPDGQYTAELDVLYKNGNRPVARTNPFFIDTVSPAITVSTDFLLFAPTEDSALQTIAVHQTSSDEDQWDGQIQTAAGMAVRAYVWHGKTVDVSWDGRDDTGNLVPDGTYRYTVSAADKAGNKTVKSVDGIQVDTRPTPVSASAKLDGFSPNGDGLWDAIGFNLSVGLKDGISSWKLSMIDSGGRSQKVFSGRSPVPETVFWDGKGDGGMAPEGTYIAQLEVAYAKGNRPTAKTGRFLLSVSPPKISLDAGPFPFSPDGDGYNDILTLSLKASGPSPIDSWDVTVLDPAEHFFARWSGKGAPPAPFTWDGLSANGELVQSADDYALVATVKDALGNAGTARQKLPIDVLVMRDGDKLRIRISSITFKANTADYTDVPIDRLELNMRALNRLAEIFKRYSQYNIRIEGYAVMVYWNDPVRGKQEQENELIPLSMARAEAVKSALAKLGIDAKRISTVGLGGVNPIAPFGDLENRWKDRRVEFILVR